MFALSVPFVSLALSSALWETVSAIPFSHTSNTHSASSSSQPITLRKSTLLGNVQGNGTTLADLDSQRISDLIASLFANNTGTLSKREMESTELTFSSVLTTSVTFSQLSQPLTLVVDTTSGLTLVGQSEYQVTPAPTSEAFTLFNGLSGLLVQDTVTVPNLNPSILNFGLVDDSSLRGFKPYHGVLGLGTQVVWDGSVRNPETPGTYVEALNLGSQLFSLSFTQSSQDVDATLYIGGTDPSQDADSLPPALVVPSTLQERGIWGLGDLTITYGKQPEVVQRRSREGDFSDNSDEEDYISKGKATMKSSAKVNVEENNRKEKQGRKKSKKVDSKNRKSKGDESESDGNESDRNESNHFRGSNPSKGPSRGGKGPKKGKGGFPGGSSPNKHGKGPSNNSSPKELINAGLAIVDTGSTFLQLEESAYEAYQSATGATYDSRTGLLKLSSGQYSKLQPLSFSFSVPDGSTNEFALTNAQQVWPADQIDAINGEQGSYYLIVTKLPSSAPDYFQVAIGVEALQSLYTIFDSTDTPQITITTPTTATS